jgi:excisionase family DNA binding protein
LGFLGNREALVGRSRPDDVYTTSQAARLCRVTANTVANWIDAGRLPAFRTPGGHRRVRRDDLMRFMQETGMHRVLRDAAQVRPRLLVVDQDPGTVDVVESLLAGPEPPVDIRVARDGFEAGRMSAEFRPDVVLLVLPLVGLDGQRVCRRLAKDPLQGATVVVALAPDGPTGEAQRLLRAGASECIDRPLDLKTLRALLDRLVVSGAVS